MLVVCTACSDREPRLTASLLRCEGVESCKLLAQVEPGCLETWGDLVNAGFECVTNARHLGINRNAQAVLMRARKFKPSHVIFAGDWCELPADALVRLAGSGSSLTSLRRPGFNQGTTPLAWCASIETLGHVLAQWCTKRRDDYGWCVGRTIRESGGTIVETFAY